MCSLSDLQTKQWIDFFPIETPQDPNHTLSLDFITGLPISERKDALLTVTDSHWRTYESETSYSLYDNNDCWRHCLFVSRLLLPYLRSPDQVDIWQDARFTSKFWQTLTDLLGIKLGLTAAYRPAADGQSEKTNDIVETALRCFIAGDTSKYSTSVQYLPIVEHEYNCTVHSSTGFRPNQLRYALDLRSVPDAFLPNTITSTSETAQEMADRRLEESRWWGQR